MDSHLFAKKVTNIGAKASSAVRYAGYQISRGIESTVTFVLERAGIKIEPDNVSWKNHVKHGMVVIGGCGRIVGFVDELAADGIKISPVKEGFQHPITVPFAWVDQVDTRVHLNIDHEERSEIL